MSTRRTVAVATIALAALAAAPAWAQFGVAGGPDTAQSTARPPKVEPPEPARQWLAYAVAVVVGGLVVGVALMPSQRTHQD